MSARAASSRATATLQNLPPPPPPLRSYLPKLDKEDKAKNKAVAAARRRKLGEPTMTAPTMAAPTANMANISEAGDTAVHHGESSPAAGRGARTVVHVALQATPPPWKKGKPPKNSDPMVC